MECFTQELVCQGLKRDEEGEGGGLRSIDETTETDKYRLSDYGKMTNKGHNSLLKLVKKEDTKKGIQGKYQETQTQRLDRETTAWTIP